MKKYLLTLLLTLSPLFSFADTPAIRPDIDELFTVMRLEKTMQNAMEQMKKMVPQMTANVLAQGNLPPEAVEKGKSSQEKIFALLEQEMSWQKMKGELAQVYAESLTPEEVKGITAFYKSPAGQAFLDKQPLIMQKSMAMQQKLMKGMIPKIQALIQSEIEQAKPAQ